MIEAPEKLETKRLILRKYQPEDVDAVFSYAHNENVVKYMSWPRHISIEDSKDFVNYAIKAFENQIEFAFAIILKEKNVLIGSTGFQMLDDNTAFFGFIIHPDYWNKGYATEAAVFIYEWLKKQPDIKYIVASCHNNNDKAKNVLEKIGIPLDYIKSGSTSFPNLTEDNNEACFYKAFVK